MCAVNCEAARAEFPSLEKSMNLDVIFTNSRHSACMSDTGDSRAKPFLTQAHHTPIYIDIYFTD